MNALLFLLIRHDMIFLDVDCTTDFVICSLLNMKLWVLQSEDNTFYAFWEE